MRKRLLLAAGTMAGLVGVALVGVSMLPSGPGVTKANFDLIKDGMTSEEVEAVFGRPPNHRQVFPGEQILPTRSYDWWGRGDDALAEIVFDDDRVIGKIWQPSPESLLDRIRRWLRL